MFFYNSFFKDSLFDRNVWNRKPGVAPDPLNLIQGRGRLCWRLKPAVGVV